MKRASAVRRYGGVSAVERRADRRRRLLAAGRQLWGESGVAEVTVRGVCGLAGLTPRYFYEEFPDRTALLFAVVDDAQAELHGALLAAGLGEPGSLADKLRSGLTAFLDLIAADPHLHRIVSGDVAAVAGLAEHRARILDVITDSVLVYAPQVLGSAAPDLVELRRSTLFMVGGANRVIEAWLADPTETPAEIAAHCAEFCMAMIRGSRPAQTP